MNKQCAYYIIYTVQCTLYIEYSTLHSMLYTSSTCCMMLYAAFIRIGMMSRESRAERARSHVPNVRGVTCALRNEICRSFTATEAYKIIN